MNIKRLRVASLLLASLMLAPRITAQTFATLHSFSALISNKNADGANSNAGLVLIGVRLYGTTTYGGGAGAGTVFSVNTDGTGFTNLHSFTGGASDGSGPQAGLVLCGSTVYGTTAGGGSLGHGVIFAINTDGTGFRLLHSFNGTDGAFPASALIASGDTLYGTTDWGGSTWGTGTLGRGFGSVFAITTNGTAFKTLYSFTGGSDGANPQYAALALSGNTLYGSTYGGGDGNAGTLFALTTDGSAFTLLHGFSSLSSGSYGSNDDGGTPDAALTVLGSTIFGTAFRGGLWGHGTIFRVNSDGTDFTVLYDFSGGTDGSGPEAGLVVWGDALFGTTSVGGDSDGGTVFQINTDGTGFTRLYSFSAGYPNNVSGSNSDGILPKADLLLSGNSLCGTTYRGGSSGSGTVFGLSFASASAPTLTITPTAGNVVLNWASDSTGFNLQSSTNVTSPGSWTNVSIVPFAVNGQNFVTNPISAAQQFFRLIQ